MEECVANCVVLILTCEVSCYAWIWNVRYAKTELQTPIPECLSSRVYFSTKDAWRQTFTHAPFFVASLFSSVHILAPEILSVPCFVYCFAFDTAGQCAKFCPLLMCWFLGAWQYCEKRLLATSCLSVCPSFRMEQLSSNCTDFHEIWYLSPFFESISRKSSFTKTWQE